MIKHIVCFKLKDGVDVNKTADVLKSMLGKVPSVLELNVGIDFLHSERSYDIVLEVLLQDRNMLDIYQNDPYHCSVVKKYMHEVRTESVAIDFDL